MNTIKKVYSTIRSKEVLLLVTAIALSVIARSFTFQRYVIGSDESTYLLMGQRLLNGMIPYSEIWDTKPIGITYISGALQYLFGESILMIRLVNAVLHGICAFFVYKIVSRFNIKFPPLLTILIVLLFFSLKTYSLPANTEIFFITFTMLSFSILQTAKSLKSHLLAGLMLGIAFQIKYFVLFDYFAFVLFIFINGQITTIKETLKRITAFSSTFLMPFILTTIAFYLSDAWSDYYQATFIVPMNYSAQFEFLAFKKFLLKFFNGHGIQLLLSIFALITVKFTTEQKKVNLFLVAWIVFALSATIMPKTFFGHYQMQVTLPVLILLIAMLTALLRNKSMQIIKKIYTTLLIISTLLISGVVYNFHRQYIQKPDKLSDVYVYLKSTLASSDTMYVGTSGYQVLYYLLKKEVPTKYVHPSLLLNTERATRLGINYKNEFTKIYNKNITFIVIAGSTVIPHMTMNQRKNYRLTREFPLNKSESVYIYKREATL